MTAKSPITCHVLDSSTGKPAPRVLVRLQQLERSDDDNAPDIFQPLAKGYTDLDGRCLDLLPPAGSEEEKKEKTALQAGQTYKLVFKTKEYFEATDRTSFYPWVEITFTIANPDEHYHVPLLISPYSFTTYRGS
ncbi:putative transthyretin family. 5-hydroxyisourate hydrolase subfamily protein [Lyophyllum shimeji]|uniref:5-hydroxyisourate hydrolase n=1 Tax=Lyophyllum shimeji TaxID=47721 RepID=A0A9P3PGZ6_LYOSH|nr:putative transthyretin family. 5-hydroxyisourate hydrolase subfamily protein [Lyophyllum shimeji]